MLQLRAPAKLNLYLRVLGERPAGYHKIETVFERIDLADELSFEAHATEIQLTCDDPHLSCDEDNLVLKAARLLQQVSGTREGATIHLAKRIPIAAGLGGGSSDAAAALTGLNQLWNLWLSPSRLQKLGAALGSDVPFFLYNTPFAIGRGRGEDCEPIHTEHTLAHVLVVPNAQLSTAEIYRGTEFNLTAPKPSISIVAHALRNGSLDELARGLWNDLAPEAIRRCPVIATIQSQLRDLGCRGIGLSGSGPSVFGLCQDRIHAQDVAARLAAQPDVPQEGQRIDSSRPWRVEIIQTDYPVRVTSPSVS